MPRRAVVDGCGIIVDDMADRGVIRDEHGSVPAEWARDFEAAARRSLRQRLDYGFVKTFKPVLDEGRFRSFATLEEYRRWCEASLPSWLGYGRAV